MEKQEFDFWQSHSLHYLEMAFRTDKIEIVKNPDGFGKRTGECGDTVEMFLTVKNDLIRAVSFTTDGCMNTNACANTVAVLTEGRSVAEAWKITPDDVAGFLETLPPEEVHCAELAVGAFYLALADLQEHRQAPWKKLYKQRH
jgi:nitrogen fixation protein NifU and related proteins